MISIPSRHPSLALSSLLLLFLTLIPVPSASSADQAPELRHAFFFVATNGNDAWSGTRAILSPSTTNGPFATLSRALDAARDWRKNPNVASNAVVGIFVRSGVHYLAQPLVLKPEDSGLVLSSYSTERPVISGGRRITGWRPVVVNGTNAWVAEVPQARNGNWLFHQLWVNGQRAVRARYPAHGYLKVAEVPDKTADWRTGNTRFRFKPGDLKLWNTTTDGEAVVMEAWVESRLPIASLDESGRLIAFKKRSVWSLHSGDIYYLEGALDFLDQPGEWCLDSTRGLLYYLPRPGEVINQVEVVAPVLPQILRLEGRPETGELVNHIRFKGLSFSHTEWYFPQGFATGRAMQGIYPPPSEEAGGFAQADIGVPGAVWGQSIRGCSWKDCAFTHLGTYALELALGCDHNLISRCTFIDLGAGGIKIGEKAPSTKPAEQTHDNEISDCRIFDGGKFFHSGYGIWLGVTANNRITHNHVANFYSTGISLGWTFGYGSWPSTNNLVAFNHVHHMGAKEDGESAILSDLGGIYTVGVQSGTKIVNNLVHDITALTSPAIGIYLDEASCGILVESNLVYRTTDSCFALHFGATNAAVNNIFAFGRDRQIDRNTAEPHLSLIFMRNIVYFDTGVLLTGEWQPLQCRVDSNLYFDARPGVSPYRILFGKNTWQQWRAMGHDQYSLIADPLFRDPRHYDFRLSSNSPASQISFQPIDLSQVGVRN